MRRYDMAVIGGGASGCCLAAELGEAGMSVLLLERGERLGRKLSATGNGQGNVTNVDMSVDKYFGGGKRIVRDIVGTDHRAALLPFCGIFEADERGRVYPAGRQASSLTDELRHRIARTNVDVRFGAFVTGLDAGFEIRTESGERYLSDNIALCAGGKAAKQFGTDGNAYALAEGLGHTVTPLYPALVQLKADMRELRTLKGLRFDCAVTAYADGAKLKRTRGDVIFTDYGLTGNAIFTLSSCLTDKRHASVSMEFLPSVTLDAVREDVERKKLAGYEGGDLLRCTLNNQLGKVIVKRAGEDPVAIAKTVKDFRMDITGTLGFDNAQVTHGGIDMREVTEELESRFVPGLFFAGEILDVDGECGGYNLHWAITSAHRVATAVKMRK